MSDSVTVSVPDPAPVYSESLLSSLRCCFRPFATCLRPLLVPRLREQRAG